MSDTDTSSGVAVSSDGITVRKAYETDEFPVPAITFDLASEREDAAVVRLVDAAPEGVSPNDLGFNPDYGGDHWSIEDGYAVFERRLAPGEEYRTVYGLRNVDLDPGQGTGDPVINVTAVDGSDEDDGHVETPGGTTTATPGGTGGVGAALAAEIRSGELSTADRELLDEEFGRSGSDEARLSHLQSRISDLEAYSDALEAFIDEHGTSREVIEDAADRLDAIETEVDDLAERAEDNAMTIERLSERTEETGTDIDRLAERTDETAAAIDDLAERTDEHATDIDALDRGIADAQAEIEETQAWLDDLREDVDELDAWRTRISSVFGTDAEDDEGS
jgi:exonuclease VII small subunit